MPGKREAQKAARERNKAEMAKQHAELNRKTKAASGRRMKYLLQQSSIFQHFMSRSMGRASSGSGSNSKDAFDLRREATASASASDVVENSGKRKGKERKDMSPRSGSNGEPSLGSPRRQQRATTEVEEDEEEILKEEDEEIGPVRLTAQPSIIKFGTLRDYQLEGTWKPSFCLPPFCELFRTHPHSRPELAYFLATAGLERHPR